MKFGILLPVEGNVTNSTPNPDLAIKVARRAEELGFDSVWAGERLLLSQRLDPTSILSAVASKTERVRLGTAVMIAPLKPPLILANLLASLDIISNGRLIAGFGVGTERIGKEFENVGVPFAERGRRLNESIEILRQAWSRSEIRFKGRFFRIENVEMKLKPKQKNGPPIWLAGIKGVSLRRVAKYADGWMPIETLPHDYSVASKQIDSYVNELRRDSSPRIEKALYLTINLRDTEEDAKSESKRFLETYYSIKFPSVDKMGFFGTVKGLAKRIEDYSSVGVQTIIVRFASFSDQLKEVERFKQEVATSF